MYNNDLSLLCRKTRIKLRKKEEKNNNGILYRIKIVYPCGTGLFEPKILNTFLPGPILRSMRMNEIFVFNVRTILHISIKFIIN